MPIPKYDDLFNPTLKALHDLGGSASNQELEDEVAQALNLNEDELSIIMPNQNRSKFSYRLAWARSYLKRSGLIDNTARGIWTLTKEGKNTKEVDKDEINRIARAESLKLSKNKKAKESKEASDEDSWKLELLKVLKSMPPEAFERLCQRFLRESGFVQVEVTGRGGDGGIDGHGVVKLGGLLSFHVYFQAKRYKGSVTASIVRDFRGAMVGRADKGLIITTGVFTRDALKEAQRDGATPIDLIDGDELAQKMKELNMGITVEERIVEEINIEREWVESFWAILKRAFIGTFHKMSTKYLPLYLNEFTYRFNQNGAPNLYRKVLTNALNYPNQQ